MQFSSTIKVSGITPQDFGALATVELEQPSVGIDVTPGPTCELSFTEDAASLFEIGKTLYLTISDTA